MLIIEFIRYLLGYVNFKAYGGLADRFLNLCTRDKIPVWNIKNVKGVILACTTVSGYFALKRPARKSGMKIVAVEKKGLRFFLRKNRSRVGLVAGALIFIGVIVALSQFVWSVSVVGNVELEEDYILSVFEEHGVKVGAKVSTIDSKEIAKKVVSEMEGLSWAAVNRKGSVIVIEVREGIKAPEIYDSKTPTNLVASQDGVIMSIDILNGKEEVKPGWAVTKGDLLVSGVISRANGEEMLVHADGYVKALVDKTNTFSGDEFKLYSVCNEKTRKSILFFWLTIPLGKSVPQEMYVKQNTFLKNENLLLPLGIITEYGAEYVEIKDKVNETLKTKIALYSGACYNKELMKDSEIRSSKLERIETEYGAQYKSSVKCKQEIGVLQEIYVEKVDDNQ